MTIIIYFSRKDENFVNGQIKTLVKGNTEILAEKIGEKLQLSVVEICPKVPYPYDYYEAMAIVEKEKVTKGKPVFHELAIDWYRVETIFLGFPNWFGSLPQIVVHFLETVDLSAKTIYPFCTHEGSAFGCSLVELQKFCPNSNIKLGLPVRGSRVEKADNAISNWLTQYPISEEI